MKIHLSNAAKMVIAALYSEKYLAQPGWSPEHMLYDLNTDPEENVNLAGDSNYKTVVESMEKMLDEMKNRTQ